ncbi:MAG: hypothetical protein WCJ19_00595 [bacterium]
MTEKNKQKYNITAEKLLKSARIEEKDCMEFMSGGFEDSLLNKIHIQSINLNTEASILRKIVCLYKNKNFLYGTIAISFMFFFLLLAVSILLLLPNKESPKGNLDNNTTASLEYVEGEVERKQLDGAWLKLDEQSTLAEGDTLRVNGKGKAVVRLGEGSSLRLGDDTELEITSLNPHDLIFTNNTGEIYSRVIKLDRSFQVKSNDISYISLGTAYLTINRVGKKGVEVYDNVVNISGKPLNSEVSVDQGNKYYFENNDDQTAIGIIDPISSEEMLKNNFVVWNKQEDEQNPNYNKNMGVLVNISVPTLTISSPSNNTITNEDNIVIKGSTDINTKIYINNNEIATKNGYFEFSVTLHDGNNIILVEAVSDQNHKTIKNIYVTKSPKITDVINPTIKSRIIMSSPSPTPSITKKVTPTPKPTSTPIPNLGTLTLVVTKSSDGLNFEWSVYGANVSKGYKVLLDSKPSPVYPGSNFIYLDDGDLRSYKWLVSDGKVYYARICQYIGNKCGIYSNTVTITAPILTPTPTPLPTATVVPSSITLNYDGFTNVKWSFNGEKPNSFKVLWSKNPNPEDPYRLGDYGVYITDTDLLSANLSPLSGVGVYYVRIIGFYHDGISIYSNSIVVDL